VGAAEAVPPGAAARGAEPAVAPGLAAVAEAAVAGEPAEVVAQEARPAQSSPRRWYRRQG